MAKRLNLTGQRFGSAVAKEKLNTRYSDGSVMWRCLCDCGAWFDAPAFWLRSGSIKDCGKHRGEKSRAARHKRTPVNTTRIQDFLCHHRPTGDANA